MSEIIESKEQGYKLSYWQLYGPIILIIFPLVFLGLLFNVLYYSLKVDPVIDLAIVSVGGSLTIISIYTYYLKIASELHGRKILVLTFRESRSKVWSDFVMVKEINKVSEEVERNVKRDTISNPPPIIPLEFVVENAPFNRMIVLSPCESEDLLDFNADTVLWKGFLPKASMGYLDVTVVKKIHAEEYIPVVVPTGCSHITENIQKCAGHFTVSKEEIDEIVKPGGLYDRWRSVELKELLYTREAELNSALKVIEDFDKAVDERAAAKVRAYLKTRKKARTISVPSLFKVKRFWLVLGLLFALGFLLWLWLG